MNETKPIYASKGVIGSVIAVVALGAKLLGFEITPDDQAALNDMILSGAAIVGALVALYGRITATRKIG